METYTAHVSIEIDAPIAEVWDALVNPEIIKQYLFGTNVESTWKVGDPIKYKGVWEGKEYEDKGKILEIVPNKVLKNTYWSNLAGTEDKSENYVTITQTLSENNGMVTLDLTQDNIKDEDSKDHSEHNWMTVLLEMKRILES